MWIAWLLPLFLALVLTPDRGTCQIGAQNKRCADCPKILVNEDPAWRKKVIDGKVNTYIDCPHTYSIRYLWKNRVVCASKTLSWVQELKKCLDGDRKCLTDASSSSQKEFSKGTNEKPSTTTINVPTTAPMTSMKPSTPSWDDNIGQSTEPAKDGATTPPANIVALNDRSTKSLDPNKANINLAQGNDQPSENSNEEVDGKMKHMKTAIISLVTIVLVLVAISVGLFFRKRRTKVPCGSGSMEYVAASSQDTVNLFAS